MGSSASGSGGCGDEPAADEQTAWQRATSCSGCICAARNAQCAPSLYDMFCAPCKRTLAGNPPCALRGRARASTGTQRRPAPQRSGWTRRSWRAPACVRHKRCSVSSAGRGHSPAALCNMHTDNACCRHSAGAPAQSTPAGAAGPRSCPVCCQGGNNHQQQQAKAQAAEHVV